MDFMVGRRWLWILALVGALGCFDDDDGVIDTDEECAAAGGIPVARNGVAASPCFVPGHVVIGGATWHGEIEGVVCCGPPRPTP